MNFGEAPMPDRLRTAAAVSAALLGFISLQQVVGVTGYLNELPGEQVALALAGVGAYILSYVLPLCVGVFASLWLVAPIAARLPLASVVRRAALAAGAGALVAMIVRTVLYSADAFSGVGSFTGNSFPALPLERVAHELGSAFTGTLGTFLQLLPLVMLLSIFVWMWLARRPSRHAVLADAGEV